MEISIYYFTGTGNSLAVARDLAERLQAELIPMQTAVGNAEIMSDSDAVGFVFPVYNHRIPYIVKRFVDRLQIPDGKYLFAVCTCGDSPCISLEYLSGIIHKKGGQLSLGYGVKMPYNYINPPKGLSGLFKPFVLRETSIEDQRKMFEACGQKLGMICKNVLKRKQGPVEAEYQGIEHAMDFFNLRETLQKSVWLKVGGYKGKTDLSYMESVQLMDYGFHSDDRCISCGTCAGICPVGNITMSDHGPRWEHRCEQCFACLQWCPEQALQYGMGTKGCIRYHHPSVTLSDMLHNNASKG